jgi:hypothetical protein
MTARTTGVAAIVAALALVQVSVRSKPGEMRFRRKAKVMTSSSVLVVVGALAGLLLAAGSAVADPSDKRQFAADGTYKCRDGTCSGTWRINDDGLKCVTRTSPDQKPEVCEEHFSEAPGANMVFTADSDAGTLPYVFSKDGTYRCDDGKCIGAWRRTAEGRACLTQLWPTRMAEDCNPKPRSKWKYQY